MDLTSPLFLFLFLPVFLVLYLFSKQPFRLPLIVVASVVFITMGQFTAIFWLAGILVVTYAVGYGISSAQKNSRAAKWWFWLGVTTNIIVLVSFKFVSAYHAAGFAWLHMPPTWVTPISGLVVPLGLSYITFQAISYLVDVWRGNTPVEKNFFNFSAYLLFFPKLVSGPLVRYKSFSEQLNQLNPTMDDVAGGLRRLLAGFIKRTLIANQLAQVADAVFNLATPNIRPLFAWLGLIAFTLQIFFDFAGYTDMAIGLGMMIGIRLPENFNYPYIAQSISDFWRRWHMTLSTWFREYVFYPLERRRFKWAGQQINLVIVFLLTGLWHGFQPTFIVWGLLYGIAIAFESAGFGRWLKNTWRPLRHLYTLAIVMAGWVLFRAGSLTFAWGFFLRLAGNKTGLTTLPFSQTHPLPFIEPSFVLALVVALIFSLPLFPAWNRLRASMETSRAILYFGFQAAEDIFLIVLFILGLAAVVSSTFAPNLYAKF